MYCKNCGKKIADGVMFCKYCGAVLAKPQSTIKVGTPIAQTGIMHGSPKNGDKKKRKVGLIAIIVAVCLVIGAIANSVDNTKINNPGKPNRVQTVDGDSVTNGSVLSKTVMFYMDGTDLEENHQSASKSIKEMIDSSVDTNANNILIYTCGSNLWHNYNIPTDKDCIYLLKNGTINLLKEYPACNAGNQNTLKTFMEYCITNYPAQQYGLVMSDHGGGPNFGVCFDHRNNNDSLSMSELQSTFSSVGFGPNSKMEFIIFECCLMGSIEIANCMKDYANYMIASENVSYTYGSDYSFVEAFNTYNSGKDIGKAFVDKFYRASMENVSSLISLGTAYDQIIDVTFSCLDLSKVSKVEQSLDAFFKEVNKQPIMQLNVSRSSLGARRVKEAEAGYVPYDLIDLKDFVSQCEKYYSQDVDAINDAINELVVYNRASTTKMAGVTIYYPHYTNVNLDYDIFDFSPEYSKYVKAIFDSSKKPNSVQQWSTIATISQVAQPEANTAGLSLQLTQDQRDKFASADYYILAKYKLEDYTFANDEYVIVTKGNDVKLDDKNVLKANFDNRIPVIVEKNGEVTYFASPLFRTVKNGKVFYNTNVGLLFAPREEDFPGVPDEMGMNALEWVIDNTKLHNAELTMHLENDSFKILCAEQIGEGGLPSRVMLDVNGYDDIEFKNNIWSIKKDKNGKVLTNDKWESNKLVLSTSVSANDFSLKMENISNLNNNDVEYYGVMIIKDIYGHEYTTNIERLNY